MNNENEVSFEEMQIIVNDKSNELSKKLNKRVFPLLFLYENEYVAGYFTEPSREQKAIAIGKFTKTNSIQLAGMDLLNWNLIKESSDVRFTSQESKYDGLIFGASESLMSTIEILANEHKKK